MTDREKIEKEVEEGVCEFMHVHEDIVEKVEGVLPRNRNWWTCRSFLRCLETRPGLKFCMY